MKRLSMQYVRTEYGVPARCPVSSEFTHPLQWGVYIHRNIGTRVPIFTEIYVPIFTVI